MARQRRPTDEEKALWQIVIEKIPPLHPHKPSKKTLVASVKPIVAKQPKPVPVVKLKPITETVLPLGFDTHTERRLKRGQIEISARLDLHGMTQKAAREALASFIKNSAARQLRAVLVITGKGLGNKGVLKRNVPLWLEASDIRPFIQAIRPALPSHGGDGALYVLLKKI